MKEEQLPQESSVTKEQIQQPPTKTKEKSQHFKDWPNEGAFNASANNNDIRTPVSLPIKGVFPDYAAGVLLRTGPGFYKIPSNGFSIRHWFDGFTTMHRFELKASSNETCNEVLYSSKMQVEDLVKDATETGHTGTEVNFGERDPCDALYHKVKTTFGPTAKEEPSHMNIGVTLRKPRPSETKKDNLMTVTSDYAYVKHFDPATLEPVSVSKQDKIHPSLNGQMSAAHACEDPATGDIFNYNLLLGPTHSYKVFRASPTGQVEILADIKDLGVAGWCLLSEIGAFGVRGAYLHSLLLTENFVILAVWPSFYTLKGMSILTSRNVLDAIQFDPSASTKWFVIDRKQGRGVVKTFKSPAFFCFHTVNAWEEKNEKGDVDVVCELVEFPDAKILDWLQYKYIVSTEAVKTRVGRNEVQDPDAHLTRYRLENVPLKGHSRAFVTTKATADAKKIMAIPSGDLPQINPKYALKKHRYVYTLLSRGKSSFMDAISKTDTESGKSIIWEQERHTPGEPIFVARPRSEADKENGEDDGVILTVVFDGDSGKSYLLCLNAKDLTEVARAEAPVPIGMGFHGLHIPETV